MNRRDAFHRKRIAQAATAEQQHAAAYDWHRSAVSSLSPADRAKELRETAQLLADRAAALEGRQASGSNQ